MITTNKHCVNLLTWGHLVTDEAALKNLRFGDKSIIASHRSLLWWPLSANSASIWSSSSWHGNMVSAAFSGMQILAM